MTMTTMILAAAATVAAAPPARHSAVRPFLELVVAKVSCDKAPCLDRRVVQRTLRRELPVMSRCVDELVPTAGAGKLTVTLVFDASGHSDGSMTIESSNDGIKAAGSCASAFMSARFAAAGAVNTLTFTLVLTPRQH